MFEIPATVDVAYACLFVGALFILRHFMAMRRIRRVAWRPPGFVFSDDWRATKPLAYGPELEPERRHAARQLNAGLVFLAGGLVLFAWLLTLDVLGPFFVEGALG